MAYLYGLNFMEQWTRAFELDPELVFVTGWNEWTVGRWNNWPSENPYLPFSFPDQYSRDKSRDIEPVKSWGDYGDVYYQQLISQVRKFKGMARQEPASVGKTIPIGQFSAWADVKPEFWSYWGNTRPRNHPGQGNALVYSDYSGRNDIVLAKVARDYQNLYFYVETAAPLTARTDPGWMRLLIDSDRNKATGWQGYDYIINRLAPGDSAVVERALTTWNWIKVNSISYAVNGNKLEFKVPRTIVNLPDGEAVDFEFKWSDNMQDEGNIMDFYVHGDVAPGGRFNYLYSTDPVSPPRLQTKIFLQGCAIIEQNSGQVVQTDHLHQANLIPLQSPLLPKGLDPYGRGCGNHSDQCG